MAEQNEININVRDFSLSPGPRYVKQGDSSGELFYHEVLNKKFYEAIKENKKVIANLDGVDGYMSSFLDEAFGNLVYDFGLEEVQNRLSFISTEEPEWIEMITKETYTAWIKRRKKKSAPKITVEHPDWKQFSGGSFIDINYEVCL